MRLLGLAVLIFLLASLLMGPLHVVFSLPGNGTVLAPFSNNVPNIDGKWSTPTEWTDGQEVSIQNQAGWSLYGWLKHNSTFLFVLLDFITDQSYSGGDNSILGVDTLDQGGNGPQTDDYLFSLLSGCGPPACSFVYQGSGSDAWTRITKPSGFQAVVGFSSVNDPYEGGRNHETYEFRIPRAFLGTSSSFGFYVLSCASTQIILQWPGPSVNYPYFSCPDGPNGASYIPAPGNWGDIQLGPSPPPLPFDYHITLSPNSGIVAQGGSITAGVTATLTSGSTTPVEFSASGAPSGVTVSFSPTSCYPSCQTTITIAASDSATLDTSSIVITGTPGGASSSSATLTVTVVSSSGVGPGPGGGGGSIGAYLLVAILVVILAALALIFIMKRGKPLASPLARATRFPRVASGE